jgi:protein dithiol:quinone oxidoreductase
LIQWFDNAPRRVLALVSAVCVGMLAFGLYLQHVVGLNPCPMCIVQRYALLLVAIVAGLTALTRGRIPLMAGSFLMLLIAGFGGFVAARQSWLQ